jgi:hypothetical protein
VIERGARVEHQLAHEDLQHRIIQVRKRHAPDVLARALVVLEALADGVSAAFLQRCDSVSEVD